MAKRTKRPDDICVGCNAKVGKYRSTLLKGYRLCFSCHDKLFKPGEFRNKFIYILGKTP
jgi:hypothetical protein